MCHLHYHHRPPLLQKNQFEIFDSKSYREEATPMALYTSSQMVSCFWKAEGRRK